MIHPLRNQSIRFKLTASLVAVVSVVLLISTTAGLIDQHQSAKASLTSQMTALAEVLGDASSTALQFDDGETANEVLASLRRVPSVVFAQTSDPHGQRFAVYRAEELTSDVAPIFFGEERALIRDGYLHVSTNIGESDTHLGSLYLRASMKELYASLRRKIQLAILSLLVCLGIATLLGFWAQRAVSAPILQLAAATEKVSREADYSARAQKCSDDELGVLCDGFNAMLDQIQQRDRELDEHRSNLEELVQERTSRLTDANEQLERSNQELDDFAYIVSHDLKEPLRGISRYSSFLFEDYEDELDDAGREKLETLQRLCSRQENLIDSLLHYSRVGRAELAIKETDLNGVVEEVMEMMNVTLQEKGIEIRIPRHLPAVRCDSVRIVEVFRNLITNAVKYNDKPEKWVEIGYERNGRLPSKDDEDSACDKGLVFYVSDNGIGIREKHQKSVFRIFKRLHGRDKYGGGTGAGLTFVKKILERHGGRIWLESSYGEGTTFYFTIQKELNHEGSTCP